MKFSLQAKARTTSEKSVGISCAEQQMTSLGVLCASEQKSHIKSTKREIQPRGSIYLQLNRKVYMNDIEKIIKDF